MRTKLSATLSKVGMFAATAALVALASPTAGALTISDAPLFLTQSAEPLVLISMASDEQLFHKAYTDYDDIDNDGLIDTNYKDSFNYTGYFDPKKCYKYSGDEKSGLFVPTADAAGTNSHSCDTVSGGGRWSGNFLNWAAMTRMDAMRRVLYGGYRSTDSSTETVLERAYLPSDNHAWIKLYSGSDLGQFTPYDISSYPSGITMCNVTPKGTSTNRSETNTTTPRLRVAKGQWTEWAAQEQKQCLWKGEFSSDAGASPDEDTNQKIAEFTVRVKADRKSVV